MFDLLKAGGFLIWPILLCSVVAFAIIIERISSLHTNNVAPHELTEQVDEYLENGGGIDAKLITKIEQWGATPLGKVLTVGLNHSNKHRVVMEKAVEEAGAHENHDLKKRLQTLGTIATITPLLGLLGTVIGMIKVFAAITSFGIGDPQVLAEGISEALVTTATGLSVGIPSLMFHRYFSDKVNELSVDMERQATKFVEISQRK